MASSPGFLTERPWQRLGNFKVCTHSYMTKEEGERRLRAATEARSRSTLDQLSPLPDRKKQASHRRRSHRVRPGVYREMNWDDHIILNGIIFYLSNSYVPGGSRLPWWDVKGVLICRACPHGSCGFPLLLAAPPVCPLSLPSPCLYRHRADIICSSSICRRVFLLFALRFAILLYGIRLKCLRNSSCGILDVCRFHELHGALQLRAGPIFEAFSFFKYLMYAPWYHSLHHTQFRTNYCLFMPFYDYIYGTVDMSTEKLYKNSLKGKELASKPFAPRPSLWLAWPLSYACISGTAFTLERHRLKELKIQTWIIPRFSFQYLLSKENEFMTLKPGTDRVLLRGNPSKASCAIALALCQRGTKVIVVRREEFVALKLCVATNLAAHLVLSDDYTPKFPVKKTHEDCAYQMTPAMAVPRTLENMHTRENWLPRRVMTLNHGFLPLSP
ncbi:hypothetical protein OPV22_001594 [Ensete ventricosum]|uniref:Very-long-chain aldehyde decarbonylase CER1-like C-terminal domain-containing protein n=1 Tax=Ensete ventricosum TaxID=4639 RepID=A0AAV8QE75_ENSVE|nr:hypothetical protein OPV22_001594 [Ensete ventricosum]